MEIYTPYFYQVRFMKPYMIPLSTAVWNPRWFHQNKNQDFVYKDKNGVYNGLRAPVFAPGPMCENLCRGPKTCVTGNPQTCLFLKTYRYQLDQLDFEDVIARIERLGKYIQSLEHFTEEPIGMLLVHEAPQNQCSERRVIQEWFASHGKKVIEWQH